MELPFPNSSTYQSSKEKVSESNAENPKFYSIQSGNMCGISGSRELPDSISMYFKLIYIPRVFFCWSPPIKSAGFGFIGFGLEATESQIVPSYQFGFLFLGGNRWD